MNHQHTDRWLGIAAALVLLTAAVLVLLPFFSALLWAAIVSITLWPLREVFSKRLRLGNNAAAAIISLALLALLVAPIAAASVLLANYTEALLGQLRSLMQEGLPNPPQWLASIPLLGSWLADRWASYQHDGSALLAQSLALLEQHRGLILQAVRQLSSGIAELLLAVFFSFFVLRDGQRIAAWLSQGAMRLSEEGPELLRLTARTIEGVVYGIVGTALVSGILGWAGFALAGVPKAATLALLTFLGAFVPFGTVLVWGPAAFWLLQQGEVPWAIFMLVWGALVISSADNVIKPMLISRGSTMPFVLTLLGAVGGVIAFGVIGVFLGPTLMALAWFLAMQWMTRQLPNPSVPSTASTMQQIAQAEDQGDAR
ncbi:MAG: AI-2E family transporter [Betaproteobacteria bacterium]|nr:AI-2E family transporter [Betaproteobacteria bacterium]